MRPVNHSLFLDWLLTLHVVLRQHLQFARQLEANEHALLGCVQARAAQLPQLSGRTFAFSTRLLRLLAAGLDREVLTACAETELKQPTDPQETKLLEMTFRVICQLAPPARCNHLRLQFALELGRQWLPADERPSPEELQNWAEAAWQRHAGSSSPISADSRINRINSMIRTYFAAQTNVH